MYLTATAQWIIVSTFALAIFLCRGPYARMPGFLKPCWAIFFLTGLFIDWWWTLIILVVLAVWVDLYVEASSNCIKSCVTRGYLWLPPAYAALWVAGRVCREGVLGAPTIGARLFLCALTGTIVAELLTSGGFYLRSGYFLRPRLREFLQREACYYPGYAITVMVYISAAVYVYSLVSDRR